MKNDGWQSRGCGACAMGEAPGGLLAVAEEGEPGCQGQRMARTRTETNTRGEMITNGVDVWIG